jgi:hypothetical protein
MSILRLTKKDIFLYCLILFSINFFGGMPCTPDRDSYTEYDPSHGTLKDMQGNFVSKAKVMQTYYLTTRNYFTIYDSSPTSEDGSYNLGRGFPNHYKSKDGGIACAVNKVYDKMDTFYLIFIHSSYDTTIAIFIDSPSDPTISASYYNADTIFTKAGTDYGPIGSLRQMPTIVMKSKTH